MPTVRNFALLLLTTLGVPLAAQQPQQQQQQARWSDPKCDLKPNNNLVNQGYMYLKSATTGKFEDQRKKDLSDALRVLTEALTTGGQDKNPAAWYYLGRYYILANDAQGLDSSFKKAEALKADCAGDIALWRQFLWRTSYNAGVQAWQANNTDSALSSFRRAHGWDSSDPLSFKYSAILFFNAGQSDSSLFYFRRAADVAAANPKSAQDRKDALYNLGRIQQSLGKLAEAKATYQEFLKVFPNDPEIMATLGGLYMQMASRDSTHKDSVYKDSAFAIYREIVARGDSMGYYQLYRVGAEISQTVPEDPDTSAIGASCRSAARSRRPPLTAARIRASCDSASKALAKSFFASSQEAFNLAAQALRNSLKLNPYYRETLIFLANTDLGLRDSTEALAMSRRLLAIDPMNKQALKIMAFAQQQNHQIDSALAYFRMSDSTLVASVAVTQFDSSDTGRDVKVTVTNDRSTANPPLTLIFDFVNLQGQVVTTDTVKVPAIPPGQKQEFDLKPKGASIVAWRYRKE
ncbi:MAG TPA: tetratricopeptide repeat protein [Gemmatimonadales bacterium]|nr:tetratricopeptide repeat protein [Gemmatimonadales bacterium]